MLCQNILKTRCLRLAKNAFAIQHLLHHSIIYTFIHYPTNFVLLRWTCISEVIPAVQVAFFLLVRVFPLNLSFYLNFYNYIFLSWGNIFWELKKFSRTNGPVISTPAMMLLYTGQTCPQLRYMAQTVLMYINMAVFQNIKYLRNM